MTLFFVLGLLAPVAHAVTDADWLYAVDRPVTAQTNAERDRVAEEGMLVVLSRLTGLASVPRTPTIAAALEQPQNYYNRFVFFTTREASGEAQTHIRITFQSSAMLHLVKAAKLPVWWSKRPEVLAWLVVDDGNSREILASSSSHPLVRELRRYAADRGVKITLPLLDLDDSLAVSPADVWGKVTASLDQAAARYDADLVLVGRLSQDQTFAGDVYRGDWEVWLDGQPLAANFTTPDLAEAVRGGIDMLADRLAEKYAVLPRTQRAQRIYISGLTDILGYAELMAYLGSLEFVDALDVEAIDDSRLSISLVSRAEPEQLLALLTAQGRLREDLLSRGFEMQLIWQG
ncbi:MAG: DUF2066 domain-containing protein [Pseudomonadaceae bacterium]|nr:DUF2066 domain-containing protein [Pseudomonadaceae bacterium]